MSTGTVTYVSTNTNITTLYSYYTFFTSTTAQPDVTHVDRKIPYSLDICFFVLTLFFSIASVVGNVFLIWCFFRYLREKLSKCFVIYISIMAADMIQGLFSMPFTALIFLTTHDIPESWQHSRWFEDMCNVSGFVYNTVSRVAVHLVFLLTLDRFLAVYKPQIHRNQTSRNVYTSIIAFIWLLDLTISSVPYFHGEPYKFRIKTKMDSVCIFALFDISKVTDANNKLIYEDTYKRLMWWYMGTLTIPQTLFLVFTIVLSFMLLRRLMSQMANSQKSSKRIYVYASHTILLISLVYFICYFNWNVLQIFGIVQATLGVVCGHETVVKLTRFYLNSSFLSQFASNSCLPIFANSAINPIILYFRVVRNEMYPQSARGADKSTNDSLYSSFKRKLMSCNTRLTEILFNVKHRPSEHVEYSKLPKSKNKLQGNRIVITEIPNNTNMESNPV